MAWTVFWEGRKLLRVTGADDKQQLDHEDHRQVRATGSAAFPRSPAAPHSVSLCCLGLTSPCRCDLSLGACYPMFYLHHTGSVQVIKQKTSFYYCCCFYCAIAMSFIRALLFLWGIISGNLDRILWLTLEKVIKSWEPKMLLCCFHQTSFPILKNVFLCSDLFPDLGKIFS